MNQLTFDFGDGWRCTKCGATYAPSPPSRACPRCGWHDNPRYRLVIPPVQPHRLGMHECSSADLERIATCKGKVLAIARTGRWFTNRQLLDITGANDAPKRRRELEHVDGYRFEKRKIGGTNVLEFRMVET